MFARPVSQNFGFGFRSARFFAILLIAPCGLAAQQPPPQDPHAGHGVQGAIPTLKPMLPQLGRSQQSPGGPRITLEELEQLALANNPTLRQAQAETGASQARQRQAGLYPNPTVGYTGEEIRGGEFGGGQHGFFVSQTIVTGGKLGLSKKVASHDVRIAEIEAGEQRMRVLNGIRIGYYRVLAAQEMLELKRDQLKISQDSLATLQQLRNIGQFDESEVLQAEIELQQHEMAAAVQERSLRQAWRALAALTGKPALEPHTAVGQLDRNLPALTDEQALQRITQQSPAVEIARAAAERSQAVVARERREPIPDIELRGGLQRNGELLAPGYRAGLQGFAEVGVNIPLFNRNQGNVQAATLQAERAQSEVQRVQLVLQERAAAVLDTYHEARIMTERYRTQLLPRAQRAYEQLLQRHGNMLASWPVVLEAQRRLFQLQGEYIQSLEMHWMAAIALEGLLLTDALEAPARPADVDLQIREINVPSTARLGRRD